VNEKMKKMEKGKKDGNYDARLEKKMGIWGFLGL